MCSAQGGFTKAVRMLVKASPYLVGRKTMVIWKLAQPKPKPVQMSPGSRPPGCRPSGCYPPGCRSPGCRLPPARLPAAARPAAARPAAARPAGARPPGARGFRPNLSHSQFPIVKLCRFVNSRPIRPPAHRQTETESQPLTISHCKALQICELLAHPPTRPPARRRPNLSY